LSSVWMSVGHGRGCVGRSRPPADVCRTACHPPLHPAVGSGRRNGRLPCHPPKPTTVWSGRPVADSHCRRASRRIDGWMHLTDIFRTRFSRKMSKVTTLWSIGLKHQNFKVLLLYHGAYLLAQRCGLPIIRR
jgi:hypothetical protein